MMSGSKLGYQVLYRTGRGSGEDGGDEVELEAVLLVGEADMEDGEMESEGEREDSESLIREEPEIDGAGEARDYEVALKYTGFGLFHALLMFVNGIALLSDAVEVNECL